MSVCSIRVWRSFPVKPFLPWLKKPLFGPRKVRITRLFPGKDELPTEMLQMALGKGFRYCDSDMIERVLQTTSKTPGYVIIPLNSGMQRILRVTPSGEIVEEDPAKFRFTDHSGRWSVALVRPSREKRLLH